MLSDVSKTTGALPGRGEAKISPSLTLGCGAHLARAEETETLVFQGSSGRNGWTLRPHLEVFRGPQVGAGHLYLRTGTILGQREPGQSEASKARARGQAGTGPTGSLGPHTYMCAGPSSPQCFLISTLPHPFSPFLYVCLSPMPSEREGILMMGCQVPQNGAGAPEGPPVTPTGPDPPVRHSSPGEEFEQVLKDDRRFRQACGVPLSKLLPDLVPKKNLRT